MFRLPILASAVLLLAPVGAFAQGRLAAEPTPRPIEIPAGGYELFLALLDRAGVKPVREQDVWNLHNSSRDVIVIVLGTGFSGHRLDSLDTAHRVVRNGGAALIASDTYLVLDDFAWGNHFRITNARIRCPDNRFTHSATLQDGRVSHLEECPYVVPLPAPKEFLPDPRNPLTPVFNGDGEGLKPLTKIATNNSAYIIMPHPSGEARQPVARFPRGCVAVRADFRGHEFAPEHLNEPPLFAVGGYGPNQNDNRPYRFLAMADQSVFINQMLIEPGTENLELTYRVIDYLQGPDKRKRCLFIENGRVIEKFDGLRQAFAKPKPQMPMPNPSVLQEKAVDMGNRIIDHVETNNLMNKALLGVTKLSSIVRFFLLLLMLWTTWFLLKRMFASRKPTDLPPPPIVAGVPSGPPGVFDRRQKELIRRNNIYEPVRDLVREFFGTIGIHGEPGPKCPKVVISREVRKPESLRLAINDFWTLAFGPPQEMTAGRWRELGHYLDRLKVAHGEGKWHFPELPARVDSRNDRGSLA